MKYRLAIVTSHVIQYQDPLFKRIAEHPDVDVTVLFCSRMGAEPYEDKDLGVTLKWDLEMLRGYHHEFLRNYSPFRSGFFGYVNPGVWTAIRRGRFDAVLVMGWGSVTTWLAFLACRMFGVRWLLAGDNSFIEETRGLRSRVRRIVLTELFANTSCFMTMGAMNADYYRHYGADPGRFHAMPYAIDNDRFTVGSRLTPDERRDLRLRYAIDQERIVILFNGKLIERKRPMDILSAVERMKFRRSVAVVFVGDGVERERLARYARSNDIGEVHLVGFVNQTEMPRISAMADIMVLPSGYDPRGTAVNEAMACGLPVVVSNMVGVYGEGDIVRDGENGFVFLVGDVDRLATILDTLASDSDLRARMGKRSLEIIHGWGFDEDVAGIVEALVSLNHEHRGRQRAPPSGGDAGRKKRSADTKLGQGAAHQ